MMLPDMARLSQIAVGHCGQARIVWVYLGQFRERFKEFRNK